MSHTAVRQRELVHPVYEAARAHGYTPLQARLIAARIPALSDAIPLQELISPPLSRLDPPHSLPDLDVAVARLADAIQGDETIAIVTDHDADGGNAHAVLLTALRDVFRVPPVRIRSYISHRMREGYGVSDALVDRMLSEISGPALMITADQGSTDELRIARLRAHGIETIVTDHHEIPAAGTPASAVACINPTRRDSRFPDRTIAGCHVAFLFACAVREELIRRRVLPESTPRLSSLSDYVACATVSDCVDLGMSANNRAIVRFGLYLMNTKPRPCWRAMRRLLDLKDAYTAETLAFYVGPRINSSGRLDDAMRSVDFLMARNDGEAYQLGSVLEQENENRREIQQLMLEQAMPVAQLQDSYGVSALVVYLPAGHAGVHGVACSRLVESFGRPAVCFSPKQGADDVITGSLRSVEGVHIRDALVRANELAGGDLLRSCGGHAMAAGCSLALIDLERFQTHFRAAVAEQRDPSTMAPIIETDGAVSRTPDLELVAEIAALEPFGRQFPAPQFEGLFHLCGVRPVGDGRHLKVELEDSAGQRLGGIWFGARPSADDPLPVEAGQQLHVVYTLSANTYRGRTSVDLRVQVARVHQETPA